MSFYVERLGASLKNVPLLCLASDEFSRESAPGGGDGVESD